MGPLGMGPLGMGTLGMGPLGIPTHLVEGPTAVDYDPDRLRVFQGELEVGQLLVFGTRRVLLIDQS